MEKGKAMELSTLGLKDRAQWEAKGYQLPQFDRAAVTEATRENPCWIHFGAVNIFRAFKKEYGISPKEYNELYAQKPQ